MPSIALSKSLSITILILSLFLIEKSLAASTFPVRGGSNLVVYGAYVNNGTCHWQNYGILKKYDTQTATINRQLKRMYNNGQRRLRLLIFYSQNKDFAFRSGYIIHAGGARKHPIKKNLRNLLKEIKRIGYKSVVFSFAPLGSSAARNWEKWNNAKYHTDLNVILNLRPIIVNANMDYKIDLRSEGVPYKRGENYDIQMRYASKLWKDYTHRFGKSDTYGYSINTGGGDLAIKDRISHVEEIYGSNPPSLFDVHLYGNAGHKLQLVDKELHKRGYSQNLIIGEVFYNDAKTAAQISSAENSLSRNILYLFQWPKTRNTKHKCDINIAPPTAFKHYINAGL